MGLARRGSWLGREGLWGARDQPCCSVAGTGADSPGGADMGSWAMGRVTGGPGGLAGTVRARGALGVPSAG